MDNKVHKIRIRMGDTVIVRVGKYKGKTGKVTAVHPKLNKVTVENINVVKRHRKPTTQNPQGGTFEITKPMWVSKVGILDSGSKRASKIGYSVAKDASKVRVLKSSGRELKQ